jgi:hypothetical protein
MHVRVTKGCWKPLASCARGWITKGDGALPVGGAIRIGMHADVERPLLLFGVTA